MSTKKIKSTKLNLEQTRDKTVYKPEDMGCKWRQNMVGRQLRNNGGTGNETDEPVKNEGKTQVCVHREGLTNDTQVFTEKGRENREEVESEAFCMRLFFQHKTGSYKKKNTAL